MPLTHLVPSVLIVALGKMCLRGNSKYLPRCSQRFMDMPQISLTFSQAWFPHRRTRVASAASQEILRLDQEMKGGSGWLLLVSLTFPQCILWEGIK